MELHRGRGDRRPPDLLRPPASGLRARRDAHGRHRAPRAGGGGSVFETMVRFRTVGDADCTGCVESMAENIDLVIAEVAGTRLTERGATRADDRISEAGMEDRKREGYF